jgi:hypothetical protein
MSRATQAGHRRTWTVTAIACLAMALATAAVADDGLPAVSPDGLQLQPSPNVRVLYMRPGATIKQYKRLALLDCFVEFAKDWQRQYNDQAQGLDQQVSTRDMDRIKAALAAEFRKVFTEELQTKGGYEIVDTAAPDVLVLRPAIINLAPTAPDILTSDISSTVVSSAGSMTLYLEFYDSVSNQIIARVVDPQADDEGTAMPANAVTNKVAADRILRRWADLLRKHLDAVRGQAASP